MYSPDEQGVNVRTSAVSALLGLLLTSGAPAGSPSFTALQTTSCDPVFLKLFAPARPRVGRYEICASTSPIEALTRPGWLTERLAPLEAFGQAGAYDRSRLARLFGARRATVARGWLDEEGRYESVTLISPHPDTGFSRLEEGTLIVRFIICCT